MVNSLAQENMYLKQYKVVEIPSGATLDGMDNKVYQSIKGIGFACSDDIVSDLVPNYQKYLHPKNVQSMSFKQRMSIANELRGIAGQVVQIDSAVKRLVKIGYVTKGV
jgi:hypothetical protein